MAWIDGRDRLENGLFWMRKRFSHIVVGIVVAYACAGCLDDARRSNPLDPLSGDFENVGTLEGMTTRFYPPHAPLGNAEVRLTPGPFITESDADGRFIFRRVPAGEYSISAESEGFASRPESVSVAPGPVNEDVALRMNGLPVIRSLDLRSIHISRWWPQEDLYLLDASASVEDPDGLGDVDRVWYEIPELGITRELRETAILGRYQSILPADSFPGRNLHALQGVTFVLSVRDAAGFVSESSPATVVRVIDHTPVAMEPQAQQFVEDGRPHLVWEDSGLPFAYTYRVDVHRDAPDVQPIVATVSDVPRETTSHQIETSLPSGTYFWTVSVVDAFGNRSRSKEAGFIVP